MQTLNIPTNIPQLPRFTSAENERQVGSHHMGWFSFQPLYEIILRQQPDLLEQAEVGMGHGKEKIFILSLCPLGMNINYEYVAPKPGNFNPDLDSTLESPFNEKNGLLEFKEEWTIPEFFSYWSFVTNLYGERVQVDHCVLGFLDLPTLRNYAEALRPFSVQIVEGLGLFPLDFCPDTYTINPDLWMYLLTVLMPSGGLLVLGAPHTADDQFDRFLHERGLTGVHHVAIRVDDVQTAALLWQKKGFRPLSKQPWDGDSLCQWFLKNSAGQIIELIHRRPDNHATFYCQNIGGLRRSEMSSK